MYDIFFKIMAVKRLNSSWKPPPYGYLSYFDLFMASIMKRLK